MTPVSPAYRQYWRFDDNDINIYDDYNNDNYNENDDDHDDEMNITRSDVWEDQMM